MPADPSPGADLDLVLLLSEASHRLNQELAAQLAAVGLTVREYCVLSKARDGAFTQTQLAEMAALDKTTMVVTVDELEEAGLVERQASPVDRRARIIAVTSAGEELAGQGREIVAGVYDDVLTAMPARERKGFLDGLNRLLQRESAAPVPAERPVRRPRAPRTVRRR